MSGLGGNKVYVRPWQDAVVVIAITNFPTKGVHPLNGKLLISLGMPTVRGL